MTESAILDRLRSVRYPGFSRDIVSFGLVKETAISGSTAKVRIAITTADPKVPEQIKAGIIGVLEGWEGIAKAEVTVDATAPATAPGSSTSGGHGAAALGQTTIPGIRHVIAIASGKGGVGKSTVAANLAIALQKQGAAVGLCDCDLYGPSIAMMFGSNERPMAGEDDVIIPIEREGIRLMSMGFLLEDGAPAILRGPMVTRYTQQFLRSVAWGTLDYLVLDLPPGTGDIQLTIVQTVALAGAIIVTTPQEVALIDARKAASMFAKVNVRVLGLVENMSYFLCPNDGNRYDIFGTGGGRREAERLGVPLLAQIPLEIAVREAGDHGWPVTASAPESATARLFLHAAREIMSTCATIRPQ